MIDLAKKVNVHQTTIVRIVHAQRDYKRWGSPDLLWEIAEALQPYTTVNELLFPWKYFGDGENPRRKGAPHGR
jgi:hypothetical protein